ncbi:MAG: hypothetical protein ACRDQ5_17225 [Sciscionella sp.]
MVVGYTQEGLVEALGVDRTADARWERGEQLPQPWQRPDLAAWFHTMLEQLDDLLRHPGPELPTSPVRRGVVSLGT